MQMRARTWSSSRAWNEHSHSSSKPSELKLTAKNRNAVDSIRILAAVNAIPYLQPLLEKTGDTDALTRPG